MVRFCRETGRVRLDAQQWLILWGKGAVSPSALTVTGPFRFVAQKQAPHLVIIFPGRLLSDHALIHEAAWRAADSHLPFICL